MSKELGSKKKIDKLISTLKEDPEEAYNLEVKKLEQVLRRLSDAYYNTDTPLVDDITFDKLKSILEELDPENPFIKEIGAPTKGNKQTVKLPFEMGSLGKLDKKGFERWKTKYGTHVVVSDKLDGSSAQLYKDQTGKVMMYSRGNGIEGTDISHLIKFVVDKKTLDKIPNGTSIRGELVISRENFKKVSDYMKNPRNTVNGLVVSKTVDNKVADITDFVAYAIITPRYKQSEQMKKLKEYGLKVVEYKIFDELDYDYLSKYLMERRSKSTYDADGLVCVDNSKVYPHVGGYPDHAFAFKILLDDQIAITEVVEVIWTPSMNGYLKPKIKVKPVELLGTTITYATAHNAKFIVDNNIGKGAKVKLVRSGDVIPYILEVITPSKTGKPDYPSMPYVWNKTKVDLILKTIEGQGKQVVTIKLLTYFFKTIGVKYLSEGIITKLVENSYDTIIKILQADKDELTKIEGIGTKMIDKIYKEIDEAFKTVDLATFMSASNKFGRGLATKKLQEITKKYPDILNNNWTKEEMKTNILEIEGFSDILSEQFTENFSKFKEFYFEISKVKDLTRFVNVKKEEKKKNKQKMNNKIKDKKIVFTGFRDDNIKKYILDNGGSVSESVSKKTDLVIYIAGGENSSKYKKAVELGIKTITKEDFIKEFVE